MAEHTESDEMQRLLDHLIPLAADFGLGSIVIACCISMYVEHGEKLPPQLEPLADQLREVGNKLIEMDIES